MCGKVRTAIDVAGPGLCCDDECYINDLKATGRKCRDCKQKNVAGPRHCENHVTVNQRGSEAECQHYICHHCTYN
jgi:hypothetical protein